jgi:uncharacterized protein YdeI (BOF family)
MSRFGKLSAAAIAALFFVSTYAAEPVSITAIDARSGLVTLRDSTTGQVTQVKVNTLAALKNLKVGQQVTLEGNVTLRVHGAEPVSVTVQAAVKPAAPINDIRPRP